LDTFGITSIELGACFVDKWWPVDPEVVKYIRNRSTEFYADPISAVDIAVAFVHAEGFADGLTPSPSQSSISFIKRLGITDDQCDEIKMEISSVLSILGPEG
jgi:hypothetical protein